MSFQDNLFLGFELEHRFYALPISVVHHVFYQEVSKQSSQILKIDEIVVVEGEPYFLGKANKVLPIVFPAKNDEKLLQSLETNMRGFQLPWVIILKNHKSTIVKKSLGFRVQQIVSPFELNYTKSQSGYFSHFYAGKEYQLILI